MTRPELPARAAGAGSAAPAACGGDCLARPAETTTAGTEPTTIAATTASVTRGRRAAARARNFRCLCTKDPQWEEGTNHLTVLRSADERKTLSCPPYRLRGPLPTVSLTLCPTA